ncbi:hypothetical protein B7W85_02005 [Allorhizobium ampelinum]|nr:hypothetical protein B7W85_02005 [Allorhizobium ampelinum]
MDFEKIRVSVTWFGVETASEACRFFLWLEPAMRSEICACEMSKRGLIRLRLRRVGGPGEAINR